MFTDSTTKVDSEPLNGSNEDITNPYECEQTLNVSAGTLNLSAGTSFNPEKERLRVWLLKRLISQKPGCAPILKWSYDSMTLNDEFTDLGHHHLTLDTSHQIRAKPIFLLTPYVPPSKKDYEINFQLLFDEYFNRLPRVVSPDPVAVVTLRAVDPAGSPSLNYH
ncbi:hypothetical protein Tco_1119295 [Tanacetum coccineum]